MTIANFRFTHIVMPIYFVVTGIILIVVSRNIKHDNLKAAYLPIKNGNSLLAIITLIAGIISILCALFIIVINIISS